MQRDRNIPDMNYDTDFYTLTKFTVHTIIALFLFFVNYISFTTFALLTIINTIITIYEDDIQRYIRNFRPILAPYMYSGHNNPYFTGYETGYDEDDEL
tara:strand:+ start:299 stop:592 length:294 start_codon:yes stop_codon:yes gene_type:complete